MNDDEIARYPVIPTYARDALESLVEKSPSGIGKLAIRDFNLAMAYMKPKINAYIALNEAILSAIAIGIDVGRGNPTTAANLLSAMQRERVEKRHSAPGGSRDKKNQIRAIWATGKYSSRDICAEEECAALGMSFKTARNALKNTPSPNYLPSTGRGHPVPV